MSLSFAYQPLNTSDGDVRFLDLLPCEPDGTVCCEIKHDNLSSPEPYHAVSYAWGVSQTTFRIKLNGESILIRENMFMFLKSMAEMNPKGYRRLWIDALCIDQSNIEEKNQQVPQMGRIYSSAESVIIWLGPASDKSHIAFDAFEKTRKRIEVPGEAFNTLKFILAMPNDDQFANSMLDILNRKYWTRVWIVQELFLATQGRVTCGSRSMPLDDLVAYCDYLGPIRWIAEVPPFDMRLSPKLKTSHGCKICSRCQNFKKDENWVRSNAMVNSRAVSAMVNWMGIQSCSDVRDRLYGILGIAGDAAGFEVDYSLNCAELFFRAIRHFPKFHVLASAHQMRRLLELSREDLAEYLLTERGREQEATWSIVFKWPISSLLDTAKRYRNRKSV
jgi:Heterokaryon incompatibility protein (HET)